ncbi:MAG: DUF4105 domain-containing protein [Aureispira sp.]
MKLNNLILIILLLTSHSSFSSDKIEISILTCSPGQESYSVFGHTAIRVINKEIHTDKVYNFGMFDFNAPNFEYNFLKGKLEYFKGIQRTSDFIKSYTYEKRIVTEQILNLNEQEKIELLNRLDFLYRPENKFYLYSFLGRNCSTETRDLLSYIGVNFQNQELKKSNRNLINSYLYKMPWLKLGINLVLGKSLDKNSTHNQSMFLPDYLQKEISVSKLNGKKLVKSEQQLNSIKSRRQLNIQQILSPLLVFSFLALCFLFWFPKSVKIIISFSIGLIGFFIFVLWMFSGHEEVKFNLNIIWCNPFYLLYIPLLVKNKTNRKLSLMLVITLIGSVVIWILRMQLFDISILPIFFILGILNLQELRKSKVERNLKLAS